SRPEGDSTIPTPESILSRPASLLATIHKTSDFVITALRKCICASMSTSINLWERPAILRPLSQHDLIQEGDFSVRIPRLDRNCPARSDLQRIEPRGVVWQSLA